MDSRRRGSWTDVDLAKPYAFDFQFLSQGPIKGYYDSDQRWN